ncbi:hypothetical protein ASD54_08720 [Rhizobium sp. Root149]|uniref:hypothetical protein n=1 Tax=Rhizobium sp. Root149 TaxID=1736473 RepID=UPI000713383B|nr:hypothetical protein [Rhizobium sp. Root149]KQZ50328.1 hypothetical protein ASD54_08720 [Rhizobium sp. Root149]
MSAKAFQLMTKRAMKHLREPGVHRWLRHDGPVVGDAIELIFNPSHAVVETDGLSMTAPQPMAWVMLSHVVSIAPERGDAIDCAIDNDDTLLISGRSYQPISCRLVSHDLLEITLIEDRR